MCEWQSLCLYYLEDMTPEVAMCDRSMAPSLQTAYVVDCAVSVSKVGGRGAQAADHLWLISQVLPGRIRKVRHGRLIEGEERSGAVFHENVPLEAPMGLISPKRDRAYLSG